MRSVLIFKRIADILIGRSSNMWKRSDILFHIFARKEKQKTDEVLKVLHDFAIRVIHQRREYLTKKMNAEGGSYLLNW